MSGLAGPHHYPPSSKLATPRHQATVGAGTSLGFQGLLAGILAGYSLNPDSTTSNLVGLLNWDEESLISDEMSKS